MTSVHDWFEALDAKRMTGLLFIVLAGVAAGVFGLFPDGSDLVMRASVNGVIWATALMLVLFGGRHIDQILYYACCFIVSGLTCAIPNLFSHHDSPVSDLVILAPVGYAIIIIRLGLVTFEKMKAERAKK